MSLSFKLKIKNDTENETTPKKYITLKNQKNCQNKTLICQHKTY